MSALLRHIDAIAREQKRDVLFLHFENYLEDQELEDEDNVRTEVLEWLSQNQITYMPCMGIEGEDLIGSYLGDVYLDVPFDESNATYLKLSQYLEDEDGNMKIEGVFFFVLTLDVALEIQLDQSFEPSKGSLS